MTHSNAYLRFRVGVQWYAAHVASVIEVLQMVAISPLPETPPDILGVLTLRNKVMIVVDLRVRFGNSQTATTLDTPMIALRANNTPMTVVIDEVDNVIEITDELHHTESHTSYVDAITHWNEETLLLLDLEYLAHTLPAIT